MEVGPVRNGPIGYAAEQDPIDGTWIDLNQPITAKPPGRSDRHPHVAGFVTGQP